MKTPNLSGFTLIELLVAVTLSAILMTGIVVFVSSSLRSNVTIKNTLEESGKNDAFEARLSEVLGNVSGSWVYATGTVFGGGYMTGIFLRTAGPNMPITFLGLKTETGYCDSFSGSASETGTVIKLVLKEFASPVLRNSPPYSLSATGNMVYSGSSIIIGGIYPGDALGASGTDTELSSPSALATEGNSLYIADTMNDRVLAYNTIDGGISKLLGPEDGIRKPTSLYLSGTSLLIASSGNGRIYSLADGEGDGSAFSVRFRVAKNFSANTIRFTFPDISIITAPTVYGSFQFTGISNSSNDTVATGSSLMYVFSGSTPSFTTGTVYTIWVQNISPVPTAPGNHIVNIDFLNGGTVQYSETFAYYTKGDGSLASHTGNILKTLSGGLVYPHNITGPSSWSGNIDWSSALATNPRWDEISSHLPIADLSFGLYGNILTIKYHEYTKYDCTEGKHQIRERVEKILLR